MRKYWEINATFVHTFSNISFQTTLWGPNLILTAMSKQRTVMYSFCRTKNRKWTFFSKGKERRRKYAKECFFIFSNMFHWKSFLDIIHTKAYYANDENRQYMSFNYQYHANFIQILGLGRICFFLPDVFHRKWRIPDIRQLPDIR